MAVWQPGAYDPPPDNSTFIGTFGIGVDDLGGVPDQKTSRGIRGPLSLPSQSNPAVSYTLLVVELTMDQTIETTPAGGAYNPRAILYDDAAWTLSPDAYVLPTGGPTGIGAVSYGNPVWASYSIFGDGTGKYLGLSVEDWFEGSNPPPQQANVGSAKLWEVWGLVPVPPPPPPPVGCPEIRWPYEDPSLIASPGATGFLRVR